MNEMMDLIRDIVSLYVYLRPTELWNLFIKKEIVKFSKCYSIMSSQNDRKEKINHDMLFGSYAATINQVFKPSRNVLYVTVKIVQ